MLNNNLSGIDVCFLIASSAKKSYQKLSEIYSAIEPPTWALLLAQSCRSIGYKVNIVDANVENLTWWIYGSGINLRIYEPPWQNSKSL